VALYDREAPGLAHAAARAALKAAGVEPEEIGQLVTVSCTGFAAPGFDIALVRSLGLGQSTGRTHVGFMGCHGALNGLRVADSMIKAGLSRRVLLSATEICSVHFQYGWDPDRVVGNSLFSDGAGALVLGPGARETSWRLASSRSWIFPDSEHALTWHIGDHGFLMQLSAQVPGLIHRHLRPSLEPWLAAHGLTLESVGSWAVHPGGPRVLGAVTEALGLPASALQVSRDVLAEHGNMSSPTVLFIIDRLRRAGATLPCVALGFGPGLNAEAALFT
jgi:predicted naringenin-chalcone synthase